MPIKQIVIALCMLGVTSAAPAQTASPANRDCTPTQAKPNDANGLTTTGRDAPLTEKLAESGGVLCPPPAGDSDIRVPAPSTGSNMPVVPPAGSPSGDRSVTPK